LAAEALLSAAKSETPERARALRHRALAELLPVEMAVVERRRLAGTLLQGKCAPHEVEYSRQFLGAVGACDANIAAPYAQSMGYDSCLRVAHLGLFWLYLAHERNNVEPPTAAQTQQIFSSAVNALDLVSKPRLNPRLEGDLSFEVEVALLNEVREALKRDNVHSIREHRDALAGALGRLMDSGVVEERGMEDAVQDTLLRTDLLHAKALAEKEAPGLHPCAHCGARELHVAHFKRCSACKGPRFCGKDCQLANWPAHKAACKAARNAAAGAAPST
jgi:hypothetical protein